MPRSGIGVPSPGSSPIATRSYTRSTQLEQDKGISESEPVPRDGEQREPSGETIDRLLREGRCDVVLATAGHAGHPHLATADRVARGRDGRIEVSGWLCPTTIRNLERNPRLALALRAGGEGVQIEGEAEGITEGAVLDGYVGDAAKRPAPSQVRWTLRVRPRRSFRFAGRFHTDAISNELNRNGR